MALSPWSHWNEACTVAVPPWRARPFRIATQIAMRGSQTELRPSLHGMPTCQAAPCNDSRSEESHGTSRARCSEEGAIARWTARLCRSLSFVFARSTSRGAWRRAHPRLTHWRSHFRGPCCWICGCTVPNVAEFTPDAGFCQGIRGVGVPTWCSNSELPCGQWNFLPQCRFRGQAQ